MNILLNMCLQQGLGVSVIQERDVGTSGDSALRTLNRGSTVPWRRGSEFHLCTYWLVLGKSFPLCLASSSCIGWGCGGNQAI